MSKHEIKSILLLVPRMPYPLNSGGRIAIFETIRSLSKHYRISIIIIDDDKKNHQFLPEINKISKNVHYFYKSKIHSFINSILGLLRGLPLQVGYFYFRDVQILVNKLSKSHDIVYSFMIRTSLYCIKLENYKIHNSIDSMYLSYKKSLENSSSILWKIIYNIEIKRLFKIEKNHISIFNLTTFVNLEEYKFWKIYGNCTTLPHGVDNDLLVYNKYDKSFKNTISFIGRMDYQPNIDAVKWFLTNVSSFLDKNIQVNIIGGFASSETIEFVKKFPNTFLLGFLDDPYVNLNSNICTIAPMHTGGGLQTKILVAMGIGGIVLASSYSVKAIEGAENGNNIFVVDEPIEYAKIINDIYRNPAKYSKVKEKAKELIKNKYTVGVLEKKLCNIIDNIKK